PPVLGKNAQKLPEAVAGGPKLKPGLGKDPPNPGVGKVPLNPGVGNIPLYPGVGKNLPVPPQKKFCG
ncbi:hypothetical protein U1Q18_035657, partial [Sarracenia purpurea var. burkii]